MDTNENYITVVFNGVTDPKQIDDIVESVVHYPIVKKKEQNNGVVAYVVQGVLPDMAANLFVQALQNAGIDSVKVVTTVGNIFNL